jgi:hypothetical protein
MAKDIFGAIGEPMPLFEVQALLDDPPSWMTDRMKTRLARFASTYQARIREAQKSRHADTVRTIKETGSEIRRNIDAHERKVEEVHASVQHGRMDPAEARQELSQTCLGDDLDRPRGLSDRENGAVSSSRRRSPPAEP